MKKVRLGIIGLGNIGSQHYRNVLCGKCPEIDVTAVADLNPDRLEWAKNTFESYKANDASIPMPELVSDASEMMRSGKIDAVVVAIPHYDHARYAIEAFDCGLHVMCEKPAGVYDASARGVSAIRMG